MKRRDRATATLYSATLSTTAANGGTCDLGEPVKDHTVVAALSVFSSATATTTSILEFSLQGSLDGSNWFSINDCVLTTTQLSAKVGAFHVSNKIVSYVRAAITSATFTSTTARDTLTVTHLSHTW